MKSFKNFRIQIKRNNNPYIVLHADLDGPLHHIWFVMTLKEFKAFADGSQSAFEDGYHKLNTFGEFCTFYNFEVPSGESGETRVPYQNAIIPMFLRRAIVKLAEKVLLNLKDGEEYTIEADDKRVERWSRLYGQGTGKVKVEVSEQVREKYEASAGNESFDRNVDRLKRIALNSTSCWWQTRTVRLSPDFAGFFFSVPGMCGGLINHGTDENPDWSTHT